MPRGWCFAEACGIAASSLEQKPLSAKAVLVWREMEGTGAGHQVFEPCLVVGPDTIRVRLG